jgi:hypothetical protein
MDAGQIIFVYSRLILGALAVFLAIMLWSKTRDAAWMLMIIGIIIAYIGMIYSILELLGLVPGHSLLIGSVPLVAIVLSALRMIFIIAAFLCMVIKEYRHQ